MSVCVEWEHAAKMGKEGRLSETAARQVIADIFARANSSALPSSNVKEFLASWQARKGLEVADSSFVEYQRVAALFLEYLGKKAGKPIDAITANDVSGWRAELAKRVSGATVNKSLKIMRAAWKQAMREGLLREDVFGRIDFVKSIRARRRAFTMDELGRILNACDAEWRGLVMFGLYTGQRLGDLAGLTWDNIDTTNGELLIITGKTDRSMSIPLAVPLANHISTMPAGDKPGAPLFTGIHATLKASGTGTLSRQFYEILATAGLVKAKTHKIVKGTGKGRDARRTSGGLSFHCLRHTATSLLKNAGVSDVVAREIIGHDSEAISRVYTHIEKDTLRKAMRSMPDVTAMVKV
jgi:integrase